MDKRADIWAFGVVLFEMLTGKRLFSGETISDTLASILKDEPDWALLPVDTSRELSNLLHRCLRRDVRNRLHDIGDARIEIEETASRPERETEALRHYGGRLAWASVALVSAALLWLLGTRAARPERHDLSRRFTLTPPEMFSFFPVMALSPDGRHLVYLRRPHGERETLFVQDLHDGTVRGLDGTEGANFPFFSPDGKVVAFFAQGELRKVSIEGGPPSDDRRGSGFFPGGSWTPAGDIVYGTPSAGLFVVPASGGTPRRLTTVPENGTVSHRWPHVLPDGVGVLFTAWDVVPGKPAIGWASFETGETREILAEGSRPSVLEGRYLVYVSDGFLRAVELDLERAAVRGEPVPLGGKRLPGSGRMGFVRSFGRWPARVRFPRQRGPG